jgi:gluconolactonase
MRRALTFAWVVVAGLLPAQEFSDIRVEKMLANLKFAQSAAWSRENTLLLVSDVPANRITKINPQGPDVFRENSAGASGLAFDDKGRAYICESRGRRVIRIDKKGEIDVLADKWEGKALNGPNDVVVAKSGYIFFTDPAFGSAADTRQLDFYGVYRISSKGEVGLVAKWTTRPNGIALSPDGKTLYVSDADRRAVRAFDIGKNGETANERTVIPVVDGVPDGLEVDNTGRLFVAAKGIQVYAPDGKRITTIEMPETPSDIAFGEQDAKTMYVTAQTSLYRIRLAKTDP